MSQNILDDKKLELKDTFIFSHLDYGKAIRYAKPNCRSCRGKGIIEGDVFFDGNLLTAQEFCNYCDCVISNVKDIIKVLNIKEIREIVGDLRKVDSGKNVEA